MPPLFWSGLRNLQGLPRRRAGKQDSLTTELGTPKQSNNRRRGLLDCMSPPQNEATHPRCCDEGCLDGPGRASNKEGESWVIIPRSLSESIRQNRAMQ